MQDTQTVLTVATYFISIIVTGLTVANFIYKTILHNFKLINK